MILQIVVIIVKIDKTCLWQVMHSLMNTQAQLTLHLTQIDGHRTCLYIYHTCKALLVLCKLQADQIYPKHIEQTLANPFLTHYV